MKIKQIELGSARLKPDATFLYNKEKTKSIILRYSFEELEKLIKGGK